MNHVLLGNQAIGVLLYQFIMLFEFIQILFFVFYQVEVVNEFAEYTLVLQKTNNTMGNQTVGDAGMENGLGTSTYLSGDLILEQPRFRIDYYFAFMNPQMYILQYKQQRAFISFYSVVTGLFYAYLLILFGLNKRLFNQDRREDIKDGMKLMIKFFSIVMAVFLFLLQIPMITIYLQGFLCNEDQSLPYALNNVECFGVQHQVMIFFSTITLLIYLIFLIIQSLIYTSNNFESSLPWSSLERRLVIVRIFLKLILAFCFVFDKQGKIRGFIHIACFVMSVTVVYKRYSKAIIFNRSVYYAMIIYEVMTMWLFLAVSLHILSQKPLTIISLVLLFITGFILSFIMIALQDCRRSKFITSNSYKFTTQNEYEIYFFRLYQLIMSDTKSDRLLLNGIIFNHMLDCQNERCQCADIAEKLEGKKHLEKKKQYGSGMGDDKTFRSLTINNEELSFIKRPDASMDFNALTRNDIYREDSGAGGYPYRNQTIKTIRINESVSMQKPGDSLNVEVTISQRKKMKQTQQLFLFLALLIKEAADKFPKNVELRIIDSFVQKQKLKNEFKAIFNLMNCENCNPSIHDQFIIFRRKIQIEQILKKSHHRSIQDFGRINVVNVFKYERFYQRYLYLEHTTTFAAMNFWRELLQKSIDSTTLQLRGSEISRNYDKIQKLALKLMEIYPSEIKFYYRYGTFLKQIINNSYDALVYYEKAYNTYHNRLSKKMQPTNEQSIFGENSGAAVIMISADSLKVGTILHSNDDIEHILGYKRHEILGKNISCLMPRAIGKSHDKFIQRYFETAKATVIDTKRQLFGTSKSGYLKPVRLLVKVYPQLTQKLVFVGFIQALEKFEDMDAPNQEYEHYDHQYIITDKDGNITNVTEGLNYDLGLHSKFFQYSDSIFQQMFNITKICPSILEPDKQDLMEIDGAILEFDTRNILNHIELEQLTSDDILEIRSKLGKYQAYVQLKPMVLDKNFCTIHIYRVVLLTKFSEHHNLFMSKFTSNLTQVEDQNEESSGFGSSVDSQLVGGQLSMSSMSSTTSNSYAFNKIIKDFKKALGERRTPKNLLYLNRILAVAQLLFILLSSLDFGNKSNFITSLRQEGEQYIMIESRQIYLIQLNQNVRSLINVANGYEFNDYEVPDLINGRVKRSDYLMQIVQKQAAQLSEMHEFLIQFRDDSHGDFESSVSVDSENVNLYRLEDNNLVTSFKMPYRVGLNLFLSNLLLINSTNSSTLTTSPFVLRGSYVNSTANTKIKYTDNDKNIFFLLSNGLRDLLQGTFNATQYQRNHSYNTFVFKQTVIFMAIALLIAVISTLYILYHLWIVEKNKINILSLYALLQIKEIRKVYNKCQDYLQKIREEHQVKTENQNAIDISGASKQGSTSKIDLTSLKQFKQIFESAQFKSQRVGSGPFSPQNQNDDVFSIHESQLSEEEKETQMLRKYMQKKKIQMYKESQKKSAIPSKTNQHHLNELRYANIIRSTLEQIKDIQISEQQMMERAKSRKPGNQAKMAERKAYQDKIDKIKDKADREKKLKQNKQTSAQRQQKNQHRKDSHNNSDKDDNSSINSNTRKGQSINHLEDYMGSSAPSEADDDMTQEELDHRKKMFFRTIKNRNFKSHLVNILIGIMFMGYFIYIEMFQMFTLSELTQLQYAIPKFFDRYSNTMLSYQFIRERIINNKTLYFATGNEDNYYSEISLSNQKDINQLRIDYPNIVYPLIQFLEKSETDQLCNLILESNKTEEIFPDYQDGINKYCVNITDGILRKGMYQAMGTLNKKFSDLQITINQTSNYTKLLSLLKNETQTTMRTYMQISELYFYKVIDRFISLLRSTIDEYISSSFEIIEVIYFIFLVIQIILLIFMRQRLINSMKADIYSSRGILNLIPEDFFDENRESVESLIKKLKD